MRYRGAMGEAGLPAVEPVVALGELLPDLRERLSRSGFGPDLLGRAERVAPAQLDAVRLPVVLWSLERQGGPGAVLARLFCYGGRARRVELEDALGARLTDALLATGVVAEADGGLAARLRITPLEGVYVVSDPFDGGAATAMGPGATTMALVRLVPRGAPSVLDLGCGAGTLALVAAARGAGRAVGVDLNPRAVALARLNARLNGLTAEFRAGDVAAPVSGERFSLVVAQPPYVVLPPEERPTVYLHGGARGDELALRFAAAIPELLAEGGRALLHFDAPAGPPALHRRIREALGDAPVDLAVLAAPGPSADLQAVAYAALAAPALGERYAAAVRRYRDHLEALGAKGATRALAVLSRSDAPGGRRTIELPVPSLAGVASEALDAWLAGLDLAGAPDEALLAAAVRPAPGARLREERPLAEDEPRWALTFERPGVATDRELSPAGAALVDALAASPDVAAAAVRFAEACGEPPDAVRRTVLDFVREGLGRGILAKHPRGA